MAKTLLAEIYNFREVDAHLLTASQPNDAQLRDAAGQGVQIVINLALHDDLARAASTVHSLRRT